MIGRPGYPGHPLRQGPQIEDVGVSAAAQSIRGIPVDAEIRGIHPRHRLRERHGNRRQRAEDARRGHDRGDLGRDRLQDGCLQHAVEPQIGRPAQRDIENLDRQHIGARHEIPAGRRQGIVHGGYRLAQVGDGEVVVRRLRGGHVLPSDLRPVDPGHKAVVNIGAEVQCGHRRRIPHNKGLAQEDARVGPLHIGQFRPARTDVPIPERGRRFRETGRVKAGMTPRTHRIGRLPQPAPKPPRRFEINQLRSGGRAR